VEAVASWLDPKARERATSAARKPRIAPSQNDLSLSGLDPQPTPLAVTRRFFPESCLRYRSKRGIQSA
jgi:hypothetical protein